MKQQDNPFKVDYRQDDEPSVYYACYGSNLMGDCFMDYMSHGRNWDDRLDAQFFESYRVLLPHNIFFSGMEEDHGAAAYLDVDAPGASIGRIWRLSYAQFTSVALLESRADYQELDWDYILSHYHTYLKVPGCYGRITRLGSVDGIPVLTVTSPMNYNQHRANGLLETPREYYSTMVLEGALETAELEHKDIEPVQF